MAARPDWDEWGIGLARAVAARADCTRRRVGAVVMDAERSIVATGYNGAPPLKPGCLTDSACPRGQHYRVTELYDSLTLRTQQGEFCACGLAWPCPDAAEPGSSYDTGPGSCIAIHAEANALLRAGTKARGATLYLTESPCDGCRRLIAGAGIARVVWP